ncbi:MAG: formylglycine-generating enzyme family protein, partial [Thermoguttaceae bacterium]|nr:formylglycine-generating enzyme family protein [Thermoguttaceae bacterium]
MKRILFAFLFLFSFILTAGAQEQSYPEIVIDESGKITWGGVEIKPGEQITLKAMFLPPVPEGIIFTQLEIMFLQETINQLRNENGEHPAVKQLKQMEEQAKAILAQAEKNSLAVDELRKKSWAPLPEDVQTKLLAMVKDPEFSMTKAFKLRPQNVSYGAFNGMLEEGKRVAPVLVEYDRLKSEYGMLSTSETKENYIKALEQQIAVKEKQLDGLKQEFMTSLILPLVQECPEYGDSKEYPFDYFIPRIGFILQRYDLGWTEDDLHGLAQKLWADPSGAKKKDNTVTGGTGGNDSGDGLVPPPEARQAGERMVKTVDGIEYAFRWCPPGTFMMGSSKSEWDAARISWKSYDEKQHSVTLTKGFWMLETQVTQAMWKSLKVQKRDSSGFIGDDLPVERVSWHECREFCKALSSKLNMKVDLPTEAQWEYACRAGTTGAYAGDLDAMGWYEDNSGGKTHPVGQKKANE